MKACVVCFVNVHLTDEKHKLNPYVTLISCHNCEHEVEHIILQHDVFLQV